MRALKIAVIVMGVLIVLGTTGADRRDGAPVQSDRRCRVSARIARRCRRGAAGAGGNPHRRRSRRCGTGWRYSLQGGGADRVVLIDPRTGAVVGTDFAGALACGIGRLRLLRVPG